MNEFQKMLQKVTASPYFDQMRRSVTPLYDHLSVNHFWYYRISNTGNYSFIGSNIPWSEYCFNSNLLKSFTCLRHPSLLRTGLFLMKNETDPASQNIIDTAWTKFQINFNINLVAKTSDGIEAFGFGTRFNDSKSDERIINQLPLLRVFIKNFRDKHSRLFKLLEENQVNLTTSFGETFYEQPKGFTLPFSHEDFLLKIGCGAFLSLATREKEVLNYIADGYPATYIAQQLGLSSRTVENYIVNIKNKLTCNSKVALIQKAKDIRDTLSALF